MTHVFDADDPRVLDGTYDVCGFNRKERAAKARRIKAAALDLYEAVRSSMPYLNETLGPCEEGCECILHDLNVALAKADGKEPTHG